VKISKSEAHKTGFVVQLRMTIGQHSRDTFLINSLIQYLNCGRFSKSSTASFVKFAVSSCDDINEKIIPFFDKSPLQGTKRLDFPDPDFCRVAELMKEKAHLTAEGLDKIRKIKEGMNTGRGFTKPKSKHAPHKIKRLRLLNLNLNLN
jgi:hypothetical protein